jgi:hypothetical protein
LAFVVQAGLIITPWQIFFPEHFHAAALVVTLALFPYIFQALIFQRIPLYQAAVFTPSVVETPQFLAMYVVVASAIVKALLLLTAIVVVIAVRRRAKG